MKKSLFAAVLGLALICGSAKAQGPMGGRMMGGGMPPMMMGFGNSAVDMSKTAQTHADVFKRELNLNEKQYKKVLSIYKKEYDRRMNHLIATGQTGTQRSMPDMSAVMEAMQSGRRPDMAARPAAAEVETDPGMPMFERFFQVEQTKADQKADAKIKKQMEKMLDSDQFTKWLSLHTRMTMPRPAAESKDNSQNGENGFGGGFGGFGGGFPPMGGPGGFGM